MAAVAMIRGQHVGALSDINVNSYRVNLYQARPQHTIRVATGDKHASFRENNLQRVLISPYRANLLALKGYYIDENNIIRKDTHSKIAPMATEHKVPSNNAKTVSTPSAVAPHSQIISNSVPSASSAHAPLVGVEVASGEPIADMASLSSTPTGCASVSYITRFIISSMSLEG
jgi:hypothetical protein